MQITELFCVLPRSFLHRQLPSLAPEPFYLLDQVHLGRISLIHCLRCAPLARLDIRALYFVYQPVTILRHPTRYVFRYSSHLGSTGYIGNNKLILPSGDIELSCNIRVLSVREFSHRIGPRTWDIERVVSYTQQVVPGPVDIVPNQLRFQHNFNFCREKPELFQI